MMIASLTMTTVYRYKQGDIKYKYDDYDDSQFNYDDSVQI